jgi:hypothetical protein
VADTSSRVYYDPYDFEIDTDPYPVWKQLRDEAPLYYNEKYDFFAVSRFADVERCSRDWKTYVSGRGSVLELIKETGSARRRCTKPGCRWQCSARLACNRKGSHDQQHHPHRRVARPHLGPRRVQRGDDDDTATETTEAPADETTEATEPPAPDVEGDDDEVDDVTIAECVEDAAGMVAKLAVTNDSSDRSTYSIEVTMEGADGSQLGTAVGFVDNLESDQSTQVDAHSLTPANGQPFTCRLVSVERLAS